MEDFIAKLRPLPSTNSIVAISSLDLSKLKFPENHPGGDIISGIDILLSHYNSLLAAGYSYMGEGEDNRVKILEKDADLKKETTTATTPTTAASSSSVEDS